MAEPNGRFWKKPSFSLEQLIQFGGLVLIAAIHWLTLSSKVDSNTAIVQDIQKTQKHFVTRSEIQTLWNDQQDQLDEIDGKVVTLSKRVHEIEQPRKRKEINLPDWHNWDWEKNHGNQP